MIRHLTLETSAVVLCLMSMGACSEDGPRDDPDSRPEGSPDAGEPPDTGAPPGPYDAAPAGDVVLGLPVDLGDAGSVQAGVVAVGGEGCPATGLSVLATGRVRSNLAVDDAHVYFLGDVEFVVPCGSASCNPGVRYGGPLYRIARCGGELETVFPDVPEPDSLALGGGYLYFTSPEGIGRLATARPSTWDSISLRTRGGRACPLSHVVADATHAYFLGSCGPLPSLERIAHGGSTVEHIADLPGAADYLTVDDGHVYWSDFIAVRRTSVASGVTEDLYVKESNVAAPPVAVADGHVFTVRETLIAPTTLVRLPVTGGTSDVLATVVAPEQLEIVGGDIYWVQRGTGMFRTRIDGSGAVERVSDGSPRAFTHAGGRTYFVLSGGIASETQRLLTEPERFDAASARPVVLEAEAGGAAADDADRIVPTPDGGFVVLVRSQGDTDLGLGPLDVGTPGPLGAHVIVKYDREARPVWAHVVGPTDRRGDLAVDAEGGILCLSQNAFEVHHVKLTSSGIVSWKNERGNRLIGAVIGTDGSYVGVGDYGLEKHGPSGELLWQEGLDGSFAAFRLLLRDDGGVDVAWSYAAMPLGASGVRRYDAAGTLVWSVTLPGISLVGAALGDGDGVIVAGNALQLVTDVGSHRFAPSTLEEPPYSLLARVDGDGTIAWIRSYGGALSGLASDAGGNLTLIGGTATPGSNLDFRQPGVPGNRPTGFVLAHLDPAGDFRWSTMLGGRTPRDVATDSAGRILVAARTGEEGQTDVWFGAWPPALVSTMAPPRAR